jgi:hypothetical protein
MPTNNNLPVDLSEKKEEEDSDNHEGSYKWEAE